MFLNSNAFSKHYREWQRPAPYMSRQSSSPSVQSVQSVQQAACGHRRWATQQPALAGAMRRHPTSFSAFDDRASTILSPSDAANSAARQRSSTDHQPGPHSSAMFCDASLRTWGRPGGCGLARTRGCVPNTNPFQMRVQTTVPCAQGGTNSFLGSLHAPASVWGPCAPGSRCCGWSSWS